MKLFLLLVVGSVSVAFTSSQSTTIEPILLNNIFGTPPTPTPGFGPSTKGLEDIIVSSTEGISTLVDKEGRSCQCVPYYLCDSNNVGVDVNNPNITGFGELDVRFGEDNEITCQESVEICCTIPADPEKPKPKPDPTKLKGCGYRNPKGLGVTFNGAHTQFGEFPWVVALMDSKNLSYIGVGVLINPEVVMTGAHVIYKYPPGTIKIRAGEWDTQTEKEIFGYEERAVKETYIHSNFNHKNLQNDIALLRLERPLELTEHINVICMPEQNEVFDSHKNCIANGWGKDVFGLKGRYAVILKKVEVDMVPHSRCSALLKKTRLGANFKLHNSFVCAGGEEGKDTCQGDGGAPLVCPTGNDRYKLTGLVAWGIGCGEKNVPAAYTNVPMYRDWVDKKLEDWGLLVTSYIKEIN
ncbi:unnamed protein product [Arctia plantaginis]|uniref:Phenoloxidase-activating factor 2 n=1 Tax=Arctia plantaginis TaxID=874455 RepID=A0A8S1BR90_ARCPL|nr:unnamed protein product [Arctia plantaginis]